MSNWTKLIAASFMLVLVVGCGADSEGDNRPDSNATTDAGNDVATGGDATTTDTTDEQVTEEEFNSAMVTACNFCAEQNPRRDCPAERTVEDLLKATTVVMSIQLCGEVLVEEYDWLNGDFDCQVEGGDPVLSECQLEGDEIRCDRMVGRVALDSPELTLFPQEQMFEVLDFSVSVQVTCRKTTRSRPSGW